MGQESVFSCGIVVSELFFSRCLKRVLVVLGTKSIASTVQYRLPKRLPPLWCRKGDGERREPEATRADVTQTMVSTSSLRPVIASKPSTVPPSESPM